MAKLIEPLVDAPEAFSNIANKLNEAIWIIRAFQGMKGTAPIDVSIADANVLISIDPDAVFGGGDAPGPSYPFRGYIKNVSGTLKVRIQNGDINSDVPPEVQGGSSPVDYDTTNNVYYVSATFDSDGAYTGPVAVGRGSSVPDNTLTVAYRRIFEVSGGLVMQSVQNSLEVASCAGEFSWGSV
jgi:hypothetical protein